MNVNMLCPICQCASRRASSHMLSESTREIYHQCKNLNCGRSFVTHTTITRIVPITSEQPDPDLQPYLLKNKRRPRNTNTNSENNA